MESYLESKNFNGTILAKKDNKTIFAKARGYANLTFGIPNNMETMYGLASIGKLFTGISTLLLLKEQKMSAMDVIFPYFDKIELDVPKKLSFHHLLTHTGGVERYYTIDPFFTPQTTAEQDRWKAFWKKHPNFLLQTPIDYLPFLNDLEFIPPVGKTFYYTNTSYILLGILIRILSGQSYHDFVMEKIIRKLNLERTRFLAFDEVYENVAEGYTPFYHEGVFSKWKKNIYRLPIIGSADGGIFSNVHDLDVLFQELRNKNGLFSDIISDLIYPHAIIKETENERFCYGYGITLLYQNGELLRYGLAGGDYGVAAGAYYYPKHRLTIILLSNYNTSDDNWIFDKEFHAQFLNL